MEFSIFRVQKLKGGYRGKNTIGRTLRHLNKHEETAEISKPQNTKDNFKVGEYDYEKIKKLIEKAKAEHLKHNKRAVRKDAAVALEMIFSYTPTEANQTLEFAKKFEEAIKDFIKNEFPDITLIAFTRHCDENSFHWHLIVMPYNKKKKRFSAKDYLGGVKQMSKLQTKFAEYCKKLGLQRGISQEITKSTHKTKEEHNRQILIKEEERKERTIEEAKQAIEEIGL